MRRATAVTAPCPSSAVRWPSTATVGLVVRANGDPTAARGWAPPGTSAGQAPSTPGSGYGRAVTQIA